jgi:hypothetical protein
MNKANIGDFPLKVHPCKYWWVRYAVACTYFQEQQEKLLKAYREEVKMPTLSAYSGSQENRKIYIHMDLSENPLNPDSEEYKILNAFITKYEDHDSSERIGWLDCPFEELDQSKCPFYEPEPYYKNMPLEELRTHKGYEV